MTVASWNGLSGKTALVTGACGLIGSAIARSLAGDGANVVVHFHRSEKNAGLLCAELKALGVDAWPVKADFCDADDVESLLPRALRQCTAIDFLINSASTFSERTVQNVQWADLQSDMLVNAWTPFALGRVFSEGPNDGRDGRAIVNLIDSRIIGGDPTHAGYILSKRLLAEITVLMAKSFAPSVRVNAVAPGLIAPDEGGSGHGVPANTAKNLPLRRPGLPREVADAVVFLLKSADITGQVVYVDGGRHMRER